MEVRKSDNSLEEYNPKKIERGVRAAFKAVGKPCDDVIVTFVLSVREYNYSGNTQAN